MPSVSLDASDLLGTPYPQNSRDRSRWILAHRGERNTRDARVPYAFLVEDERAESGEVLPVTTLFLTNRECPWRCLMCDLWRDTLTQSVAPGDIPAQIDHALAQLPSARQIKLYNSGSFFDPAAIPPQDYLAIAERVGHFERVIVESHCSLIGERCWQFNELLSRTNTQLEVAMGLETVHPEVLARLNKGMTLDQFAEAAAKLRENNIALRVFILLRPPFLDEEEGLYWAQRSLDFAFDCGATVAAVIPTRAGNGALDALAQQDHFTQPKLSSLEAALAYGIGLGRGRVFADEWDLGRFSDCPHCFAARAARLHSMNLNQFVPAPIVCKHCGQTSGEPSH